MEIELSAHSVEDIEGTREVEDGTNIEECEAHDEALRQASVDTIVRMLRQRLGLGAPPSYTTVTLALERLLVLDNVDLHHQGQGFSVNLGLVGMLQPPAVIALPGTETYQVVFGRRRVLAARKLEDPPAALECHLYERLTATERAIMVLAENGRRAPAWVTEATALAQLVDAHVGLTELEIALALGIPLSTARQRLKIALLPPAIRSQVLRGDLSLGVIHRLLRLNTSARAALEQQAAAGEAITAELVRQALHGQIGVGMRVVRAALSESWQPWETTATWDEAQRGRQAEPDQQMLQPPHESGTNANRSDRSVPADIAGLPWDRDTIGHLVVELDRLSQRLQRVPGSARAGMLAAALRQELTILQRTMAHSWDASKSMQPGV